ncbi:hypothetical protein OWV82_022525 [Melia azedarach]|uniref:Uncharacterized protein n=1 Tax=Melia azedarach TaxID=155640 RepID=A0ACC1WTE7_MELAZ|nr:hypothetical protein OWV82_022525 [Melia azedarach]
MFKHFGSSSSSSSSRPSASSREEAEAQSVLSRGGDRNTRVQETDLSASQESTTGTLSQSYDAKGVLYNREENSAVNASGRRVHNSTDQQRPSPQDIFHYKNSSS